MAATHLLKALVGVIIAILSLYYIFFGIPGVIGPSWKDVLVVLNGVIPLLLIAIGIFIAWIEIDEWKIERELIEEEQVKKKKAKRKRRRS